MAFPTFSANLTVGATEAGWLITQVFNGPASVYAAERVVTTGGGTDVDAYTHTQAVPAAQWVIPHNLNRAVGVRLEDAAGNDLEADDITDVDSNNLTIDFVVAIAGTAYIT